MRNFGVARDHAGRRRPAGAALAAAAALAASALAPARADAQDAAPGAFDASMLGEGIGWNFDRLDLDVEILPETQEIKVSGTAELRLDGEASTGPIFILNKSARFMQMDALEIAGAAKDKGEAEILLNVPDPKNEGRFYQVARFDRPFAQGDRLTARFVLHSVDSGKGQFILRPDIAYAAWVERWYPTPLAVDPIFKAPGSTRLRMPKGWTGVASGDLIGHKKTKTGVEATWRADGPAARSFAAGPYTDVGEKNENGLSMRVLLLEPKSKGAGEQARQLARAIRRLETRFGPYPFASMTIAELPDGLPITAASNPNFIVASTSQFAAPDGNLALFAHEASHAWWGNLLAAGGPGGWLLSESLAQFGAMLAIEDAYGEAAGRDFLEFSRPGYALPQSARGYLSVIRSGFDMPLSELNAEIQAHLLANSKGMWVYQMLRDRLGDERMFATLRRMIEDHRNGVWRLDDLRQAFIADYPDQGLDVFFDQWLDRDGLPVIDFSWRAVARTTTQPWADGPVDEFLLGEDKPPFEYVVELEQLQDGPPFDLPLEIAVEAIDGQSTLEVVRLSERKQTFTLAAPAAPRRVVLDPKHKMLMWRPAYGPPPAAAKPAAAAND